MNGSSSNLIDPFNYTCSSGLLLPIISEATWSTGTRAFLYLLALLWCFLGVAQVADIFMGSIERITSKTKPVRISDPQAPGGIRTVDLKVWNDTVANLSLLALGTSAPEILLSVIEIVFNDMKSGDLGPGTIVGSAAFNLLFITAICIYSIPEGEIRRVASFKVFSVTAFTCIFAYVWMAIVLLGISPHRVDVWEAVVTFLMFPSLILIAYSADKDCFCLKKKRKDLHTAEFVGIPMEDSGEVASSNVQGVQNVLMHDDENVHRQPDNEELKLLAKELCRNNDLTPEESSRILRRHVTESRPHSHGFYRMNAIRALTGGLKLIPPPLNEQFQAIDLNLGKHYQHEHKEELTLEDVKDEETKPIDPNKAVVQFSSPTLAVLENEGKVRVGIKRSGKSDVAVTVRAETFSGTATSGSDFKPFNKIVKFKANELLQEIYIEIVDDFEWEPDEFFFVKLRVEPEDNCVLGSTPICQITIINDDEPGTLAFSKPSYVIKETGLKALIPVVRMSGADGHVSVKWRTEDITAVEGVDYSGRSGEIKFDNQETTKSIIIPLFDSQKIERDESFSVELVETGGGATLGKITKTVVTIVNDEEFNGLVSRILNMTKANLDALELHKTTYMQQFICAMNVNGGDIEGATFIDYILHFFSFFWKILFAFIPPVNYCGGWASFLVSLSVIGFLTAIISDLASIFGCLINLEDGITAITLVALGTSMPDTFASKTAAVMEKTADSSVGNVNGSNSVNVFLGLGLPWLIASIYWEVKGGVFWVPAASLGFTVILYTIAAIIAISVLIFRRNRKKIGAELGGPKVPKIISSILFVSLWVLYVVFSSLQTKNVINIKIGPPVPPEAYT